MKILLSVFILFSIGIFINAQTVATDTYFVQSDSSSCEINAAMYDGIANTMRDNNERLFIVAHLGKGESSRDFNRRRLYNVRAYFANWEKIESKRIVFVEGENLKTDEGRIEFYLGSNLVLVSLVKRNRDICVDCCNPNDLRYYGKGKIDKSKRRNNE